MGTFRKMLREMTRQLEPEDAWLLINEIIKTKVIPNQDLCQDCFFRQRPIENLNAKNDGMS
jgi:hypothetical protein